VSKTEIPLVHPEVVEWRLFPIENCGFTVGQLRVTERLTRRSSIWTVPTLPEKGRESPNEPWQSRWKHSLDWV